MNAIKFVSKGMMKELQQDFRYARLVEEALQQFERDMLVKSSQSCTRQLEYQIKAIWRQRIKDNKAATPDTIQLSRSIVPVSPVRTLSEPISRRPLKPMPDDSTIIFLAAFIGTTSPLQHLQVGDVVIPFPYAYPRETIFYLNRAKRSQPSKTDKVIHLPAPKTDPYAKYIGNVVHVLGSHAQYKIERVFDQYADTWVQMRHPHGVITRKLSQISQMED